VAMNLKETTRQEVVESEQEDEPRLKGTDIFRGGLVIVAALLIGGLIMTRGLVDESRPSSNQTNTETIQQEAATTTSAENSTGSSDGAAATSSTDQATVLGGADSMVDGESTEDDTVTSSTQAFLPPAEINVLVLNGSGQVGVAAKGTEALKAQSYTTAAPKNADGGSRTSAIYYVAGYEAEAGVLAEVFGPGLEDLIEPLDATAPPIDDTQGAHIIVVIGNDDRIVAP